MQRQQGDVVVGFVADQRLDGGVAQLLERVGWGGCEQLGELRHALVQRAAPAVLAALDQPVGVEQQGGAGRQVHRRLAATNADRQGSAERRGQSAGESGDRAVSGA